MRSNTPVFEQAGLSRSERRKQRREWSQMLREHRPENDEAAEETSAPLPAMGPVAPQPGVLHLGAPLRRPAHRATGLQLAAAYPFLAADQYEAAGPILGIDRRSGGAAFTFDPMEWYLRGYVMSQNLLIQGALRRGKSFLVKRLVCLLTLFDRYAINTSDSKGEHGRVAEAIGGTVYRVGQFGADVRINPLDRNEADRALRDPEIEARVRSQRHLVLQTIASLLTPDSRALTSREVVALDWALGEVIQETNDRPTIRGVYEKLRSPSIEKDSIGELERADVLTLTDGMRRLVSGDLDGMFADESTVQLDPTSPYTVFDTYSMAERGDLALAVTQAVTNAWVQSTIMQRDSGRRYVLVREEGWRDMNSIAALKAHQLQLKLSGEYGITMVMIVHEDGDFDAVGPEGSQERELARNVMRGYANRITFAQEKPALLRAVADGVYTESEAAEIAGFGRGEFLLKTQNRTFIVDAKPTSTKWELDLFDTDTANRAREKQEAKLHDDERS